MNVRLSNGTKLFISQPMIGRTTEEILKEYREVVDWCEDRFSNQKQRKDNYGYKNNDIKFINPLIPPLSPYKDELIKWFLMDALDDCTVDKFCCPIILAEIKK